MSTDAMRAAAPPAMPPTKVKGSRTRWLGTVTNKAEAVAHIGAMVAAVPLERSVSPLMEKAWNGRSTR